MSKKIVSLLLALTMTLCCCSALAENTKHERVYVVTKPDGTVENITDNVRLENADSLDELIDQTMLTSIENLGGKVAGSVSSKTDLLINNDASSNSSKNQTARKIGIPVITEEDFLERYGISF